MNIEVATERLLQDSATNNTAAAIAYLERHCGLSVRQEIREWIDPEYGFDFEVTGHSLERSEGFSMDAARSAIAALNVATPERLVNVWLADLAAVTASAKGTGDDMTAKLAAYRRRLVNYPPDVVKDVLSEAGDKHKFFPTWQELKEDLDELCDMRRILAKGVGIEYQG